MTWFSSAMKPSLGVMMIWKDPCLRLLIATRIQTR
jgi:hypothetical protein